MAEYEGTVETIPARLQLRYRDADCFGGLEAISRVSIEMSGRRSTDRRMAFGKSEIKLSKTDKGKYEWHHIPNNEIPWGSEQCGMVLLKKAVHSVPHIGAVKQYERYRRDQEGNSNFRYGS